MKNNFITVFLLLIFQFAFGQGYFQQQVNYDIKVSLNDKKQVAQATVLIDYQNNSSKALKEIKFHFWANAHQSQNASPLAKQLVEKDKLDWYFAKDDALGGYSNIEILYQNNKIEWTFEDESKEICTVKLPEELLPQKTIQLKINYQLKIPFLISRLGHVKNEYAISQWYPKPAVYNQNGWNTMPYLDQGEFFSEFGNYEVDITLPENYVVAATGTLQTESEKKWLSRIAKEQTEERKQRIGSKEITSSSNLKTIHFSAQNIHDFAWFASKRFIVDQSKLTLNKDKTIEVNSFYYPESVKVWQHSNGFAQRAIQYFSEEIGEYPYPQISVVNGDLKAGGGMEYPMITLISDTPDSQSLDQIIAHELAHNWFYGILASNERKYPWMDEGFTSFYEQKYMKAFYKNSIGQFPPFFHNKGDFSDNQIFQRLMTYQNKEESGSLSSEEFSRLGYLNAAYSKPAISLELLEGKMGEANFKKAIQHYYNIWQFKHPYPEDCKLALEKGSGQNLDWLYYDLLQSNKRTDLSIQKVTNNGNNWKINLRNNGESKIPIPISFFSKDELKKTIWLEPFVKDTTFEVSDLAANKVIIDAAGISTDCNSNNNYFNSNQIFKKCLPWKVSMLPKVANPTHNNLFVTPIPAYNSNDQFMVGVAMYKDFIPSKNWETYLMPLYSFKTNSLVGMAGAEHFWYLTKSVFQKINAGADYQSFHYNTDQSYGYFDRYQRLHSWIEATVDSKNSIWNFSFNNTLINQNYGEGIDIATKKYEFKNRNYYINEFGIDYNNKNKINPFHAKFSIQQGEGFVKSFVHGYQNVRYAAPKRGLNGNLLIHVFAGTFLNYNNPVAAVNFRMGGNTGFEYFQRDYRYENTLIGRNDNKNSLWSQQIFMQDAGLKTLSNLGSTNKYAFGFGIKDGIPLPLPIQYYFDAAVYPEFDINSSKYKTTIAYSAGLSLVLLKDQFEIYFPIIDSQNITENLKLQDRANYLQKITFLLNLKKANPYKFVRNFTF